jgi:uncharacterized protein YjbJ (UPF0337 family)
VRRFGGYVGIEREEGKLSEEDKAKNSAQQVKGNIKEKVGSATGNEDLEAKGKTDQAKGNLKQAGENVKDAVKGVSD